MSEPTPAPRKRAPRKRTPRKKAPTSTLEEVVKNIQIAAGAAIVAYNTAKPFIDKMKAGRKKKR